jgi:5' nucleotidase, deoxy (Pyrimidine), cytosolic type C protein (NT5C)
MKGFRKHEMGEFRRGGSKPVVGLDIDGVLGDYHGHFLWYAEKWFDRPMPHPDEINPGLRLSDFMRVPHHEYQECKLAYRQGGLKRFMPCYPYASELTQNIQGAGAEVWICTTRPYLRLDNIDPDTREWLRRNDIRYDAVIWEGLKEGTESTKYSDLVAQIGLMRIVAVCDDLPEQVKDAVRLGIRPVYLRDQPYNRDWSIRTAERVNNLDALWYFINLDIEKWKDDNGQERGN